MPQQNEAPSSSAFRKTAAIVFADIVGYSAMMEANEPAALSQLHIFKTCLEQNTTAFQGEIIQYYGDGCLLVFGQAIDGVRFAMATQASFQQTPGLPVRIGLHYGEVLVEAGNVFGHSVNLASRIESLAVPGAVLFSADVHAQMGNDHGIEVAALGKFDFKNISQPMAIFAVANEGFPVPRREEMQGKLKPASLGKSIAILPFVNMSPDPDNEYFSDGITEEIINALTRVKGLQVTARTSSFAFKNKNIDIREIGEQLKVASVLEGSVRMAKEKVRITAQLINVEDGFHFWSETFDRSLEDIFAVQDEISLLIADKLRENMGHFEIGEHLVNMDGVNVEAYKHYLKGKYHVQKLNKTDIEIGFDSLLQAIEIQPGFALPYLMMHHGYNFLAGLGLLSAAEAFAKSNHYLGIAKQIGGELPELYIQQAEMAYWQSWDLQEAYKWLNKALELRPGFAEAHRFLASILATEGKFDAALTACETALQLDPFSPLNHFNQGVIQYFKGDLDQAFLSFEKSLSFDPNFMMSHLVRAAAYLLEGRYDDAIEAYSNLPPSGDGNVSSIGGLALSHLLKGEMEKVKAGIERLEAEMNTERMGRALFFLVVIHAASGNHETALDLMEKGVNLRIPFMIMFRVEPFLNPLHSYPRFQQLVQQIMGAEFGAFHKKKKYKKSTLKKKNAEQYYLQLGQFMMNEKPFLDSELTLRQLAKMMDIHPNILSQVLNEYSGKNFSEYINTYRLEAFKQMAENQANHHLTILALAYDSGFNSKTVFNTFFKKTTGMTPREYWKTVMK